MTEVSNNYTMVDEYYSFSVYQMIVSVDYVSDVVDEISIEIRKREG